MTKDKLIEMFNDAKYWHQIPKLAEDVMAVIEKEREGQNVVGEFTGGMEVDVLVRQSGSNRKPVKIATLISAGSLIFRPEVKL